MHALSHLILIVEYLNLKGNAALLFISPEQAEPSVQSLRAASATLSGDSSEKKHLRLDQGVSQRNISWVRVSSDSARMRHAAWFLLILLLYHCMQRVLGKLGIAVHRVHLQVKFPCALTLLLKIENEEAPIGQEVPLRLGQALLETSVTRDLQVLYNTQRQIIQEKKVSILIFLKSRSGRIPAGAAIITVNSLNSGSNILKLPIEKCPDKQASIYLTAFWQLPGKNKSQSSLKQRDLQNEEIINVQNFASRNAFSSAPSIHSELNKQQNDNDASAESPIKQGKEPEASIYVRPKHKKYTSTIKNQESHMQRQPQQNSPNGQLQSSSRSKVGDLARDLKKAQKKLEHCTIEIKSQIKKRQLVQKALKQSESVLKGQLQKYEDLQIQHESYIKKAQFKLNALQAQLSHWTDKFACSESQKQRLLFQKNELVNGLEEREATLRQALRQKQKLSSEGRTKISQQLEQLAQELQHLKTQNHSVRERVVELTAELVQQKDKYNRSMAESKLLAKQVTQLKSQVTQQINKRLRLQEALESNIQQEERKKSRAKINQLEQEINKQKLQAAQLQASSRALKHKHEQLQNTLLEQSNLLKSSKTQNGALVKEIEALNSKLEEQSGKLKEQSGKLMEQSDKLKEQNGKLEEQNQKWQQLFLAKKKQAQNLIAKAKQMQAAQNKKLQSANQSSAKQLQQKQTMIKSLNQQIQKHCLQIGCAQKANNQLSEAYSQLHQKYSQLHQSYDKTLEEKTKLKNELLEKQVELDSFLQELENKEKLLGYQIQLRESQKLKFEHQVSQLSFSLTNTSQQLAKKISRLQIQLYDADLRIKEKSAALEEAQKRMRELEFQLSSQIEQKSGQIELLSQALNEQSKNAQLLRNSDSTVETLKEEIHILENNQLILKEQLQKLEEVQLSTLQDLQSTAKRLQLQVKKNYQLNSAIDNLQESKDTQMNAQREDLQSRLRQLAQTIESKNSRVGDLERQVAQQLQSANESELQRQQLKNEASELMVQLDIVRNELQEKEALIKQKEQSAELAQRGRSRQHELQNQLCALNQRYDCLMRKMGEQEQQLNESCSEITALRQQNTQIHIQLRNARTQLAESKAATKVQEELQDKHEKTIEQLQTRLEALQANFDQSVKSFQDKENNQTAQTSQLRNQFAQERRRSLDQLQNLANSAADLTQQKLQLNQQLRQLTLKLQAKEHSDHLQTDHLKPIRQNLIHLRSQMQECGQVANQFQASKNRLLKMSAAKLEQYNERNVADKIRQIGLAFQKLKLWIIGNADLSQDGKLLVSAEIKKVQFSLDRALRGDR